jgi:hypothetical protein
VKAQVDRCDVCGADDTDENRVCVKVAWASTRRQSNEERMYAAIYPSLFAPKRDDSVVTIDLCTACGGTMMDVLRRKKRMQDAAKRRSDKVKPAAETLASGIMAAMQNSLTKQED